MRKKQDRNIVKLVSGKQVRIKRVNPLSATGKEGDKKFKEKLFTLEMALFGRTRSEYESKIRNRENNLARVDAQAFLIKDSLDDPKLDPAVRADREKKFEEGMKLAKFIEDELLELNDKYQSELVQIAKIQCEVAVWALGEQCDLTADKAYEELDRRTEIQICACLLGIDPSSVVDEDGDKEEEEEESPLSKPPVSKESS